LNPSNELYEPLRDQAIETMDRIMGGAENVGGRSDAPLSIGRLISFGDVWNRPHLTVRERRIATLTILALNALDEPMGKHIRGALHNGDLSVDDLEELALQIGIYAGFPRASNMRKVIRAEAAAV